MLAEKGPIMSFLENLQHLRATRGMSQEQLAMLVGVSRQSVTKWESEKSYPEMDKLLKLCQIFECTLDDLVTGDLTDRAIPQVATAVSRVTPQDVCGYDEHMRSRARFVALGVGLIFAGIALGLLFSQVQVGASGEEGVLTGILTLLGVAVSLACFIPSGMRHSTFVKQHPYIEDFYTPDQKTKTTSRCAVGIVVGIALILLSLIVPMLVPQGNEVLEGCAAGIMLLVLGCGVSMIVYAGMMLGRINIKEYNDSVVDELEEGEIAELGFDEERTAQLLERKKRSSRTGAACAVIMLVATVVALCWLFLAPSIPALQDVAGLFWVAWVVGGLGCAIAAILMSVVAVK